jgi:hypothetical protein
MAGGRTPTELRQFAMLRQDVEAVLQRCGIDTFDLLLIDLAGNWTRWVFASEDAARAAVAELGVPLHEGWDDRMARRMNKRDHWNEPGGQRRAL